MYKNDNEIIKLYQKPMGIEAVASELGISTAPVRRVLKSHGIARTASETKKAMFAAMTPDERKAYWHERIPYGPMKHATKVKIANAKRSPVGPGELDMCKWLDEEGIRYEHQGVIDVYNVDFLIDNRIAVELRTGRSHGYGRAYFKKRLAALLETHPVVLIHAKTINALHACRDQLIIDIQTIASGSDAKREWRISCEEKTGDLGSYQKWKPVDGDFIYTKSIAI